jgi:hypothetical protein
MTQAQVNNPFSSERAKEIALRSIDGNYDLLLACRDLARLRDGMPCVPDDLMDVFIGVASEIDGLPIGAEREHWAAEPLRLKDILVTTYREQVTDGVMKALRALVLTLGESEKTDQTR